MKKNKHKSIFISGEDIIIGGKYYTRMYTKEEEEEMKKSPAISPEREKEIKNRSIAYMKEVNPALHKKIYPEEYK